MTDQFTPSPTMLSEFIALLQATLSKQGDMPVTANGLDFRTTCVSVDIEPSYYDGGALIPLSPGQYHCAHWGKSRGQAWKKLCHLKADEPCEDEDTIDGVPLADLSDVNGNVGYSKMREIS